MNAQPQYRLSLVLAAIVGISTVIGILHYQSVSSKFIFPIDKDTLSIT